MKPDGSSEQVVQPVYFQVLRTMYGGKGPKTVPTLAEDDDDVARKSQNAVSIQYMEVWKKHSPEYLTTYFDADPQYMNLQDVAPFATVRNELQQWKVEQSDWQGCHDLRSPTRAVPVFSLEDGCPVMVLLDKLRELEWRP